MDVRDVIRKKRDGEELARAPLSQRSTGRDMSQYDGSDRWISDHRMCVCMRRTTSVCRMRIRVP